ncbi:glycosyltransferase family protein [Methylomonas sp. ZR1]|uniref:glycosyltransferase family protein n=1 Tax=Methylomonas sp. ZR1 TaxID=1797072 RepID=UPI00149193EF|nr:glycosyltransferase [Methylomonas sp. ZR1]NOV29070.1 glycosyltransferase [Methylomonas sp. ZR1]
MTLSKQSKRIIVYSHDTFGLGNIRRMLAISKSLVDADPNVSVLILSGSPMLHAFRIPDRIDYIKLPCLSRSVKGDYSVKFLDMEYAQLLTLRSNIILSAVLDFDPDLILVDKKPYGVSDELGAALNLMQRRGHRAKLVLLLRDILDSPESTIPVWKKNGYHDAIQSHYDKVLVVGSPEIYDMRKEYEFPDASHEKVDFCGYIARERSDKRAGEIRQQIGCTQERLVLVTAGGGEDGYQLLHSYLEGLNRQDLGDNTMTLMICGPEMSESRRHQLEVLARGCRNVVIQEFNTDMMACMEAADLVVSMGGYNSTCELLTLRKRAILVPRVKPSQEQWIRAERLALQGLVRAIHPNNLTPKLLMDTVREELRRTNVHHSRMYQIDMGGLPRISQSISDLLYDCAANMPAPIRASTRSASAD